ncbi:MAG: tyrosine-type recombinase/integrase [Pyrinomonadaceae bacterium]
MTKVKLYEKKITKGRRSLFLDFYPPIKHPETGKPTRREHLRLYVYERPRDENQREHNKETKMLADSIRSQRQLDVQSGYYGFLQARNSSKNFISFFESFIETKRNTSKSNQDSYRSILNYVKGFAGEVCTFANIDESFCREFRTFLLNQPNLSTNTAASYFDKFKYVIREAYKQKMFKENPAENIRSIKLEDTEREFLTFDELKRLAQTRFHYEDLRRAALFSALTGLRYSDIEKLTWREIKADGDRSIIRFKQKKTKDNETMPLSDEAVSLIGERGKDSERVFDSLNYYQTKHLGDWMKQAGIKRKITFHAFRHTFATLQLTLGTDIYTVSKLLGHKNLQTTKVYARIVDEKKREAVNRISLDLRGTNE